MRDALGVPKITYKLPFLKGRFALAAKIIQEKKDQQTKSDFANPTNTLLGKSIGSDAELLASFKKKMKIIYPMTMWCENVQQSQNQYNFRLYYEADLCCREHDNECPMVIPSGMMWNQLKNLGIYTR